MLYPSSRRLIDKLIESTKAGRLLWSLSSVNQCQTEINGFTINITQEDYTLTLSDAEGKILERLEPKTLQNSLCADNLNYLEKVRDLYTHAKQQAAGTEGAITNILNVLDRMENDMPETHVPKMDPDKITDNDVKPSGDKNELSLDNIREAVAELATQIHQQKNVTEKQAKPVKNILKVEIEACDNINSEAIIKYIPAYSGAEMNSATGSDLILGAFDEPLEICTQTEVNYSNVPQDDIADNTSPDHTLNDVSSPSSVDTDISMQVLPHTNIVDVRTATGLPRKKTDDNIIRNGSVTIYRYNRWA